MAKPTFESRVITALARHERAHGELTLIKKSIQAELAKCPISVIANRPITMFDDHVAYAESEKMWDDSRVNHHLHQVLQITIDPEDGYHGQRKLDADEIREELEGHNDESLGCPHCLAAWDLVIRRKDVRKELGHAKRALRQLGKSAMKVTP